MNIMAGEKEVSFHRTGLIMIHLHEWDGRVSVIRSLVFQKEEGVGTMPKYAQRKRENAK